ncbi:hypothetical protein HDK64DRAFT_101286 [Phyllosticta capitalensis]
MRFSRADANRRDARGQEAMRRQSAVWRQRVRRRGRGDEGERDADLMGWARGGRRRGTSEHSTGSERGCAGAAQVDRARLCGQQQTTLFQSITGQPPVVFIHSLSSFHSPERTKTKHPTPCILPTLTAPGLTRHAALDTYLCWPAYLSFHCMPIASSSSSSSSSSCSNYFRAFFGLACLHSHSQHPSFTTTCSWPPHSPIFRPFWPLPHAHSCTKKKRHAQHLPLHDAP